MTTKFIKLYNNWTSCRITSLQVKSGSTPPPFLINLDAPIWDTFRCPYIASFYSFKISKPKQACFYEAIFQIRTTLKKTLDTWTKSKNCSQKYRNLRMFRTNDLILVQLLTYLKSIFGQYPPSISSLTAQIQYWFHSFNLWIHIWNASPYAEVGRPLMHWLVAEPRVTTTK